MDTKYFLNGREIKKGDQISCRGKIGTGDIEYKGVFDGQIADILVKAGVVNEKKIRKITKEYVLNSFYKRNGFETEDGFKFLNKLSEISEILFIKLLLKEISMIMLNEYYADTYKNCSRLWGISGYDFSVFEFEPDYHDEGCLDNICFFRSPSDAIEALKIVFDVETPNTER